MIKKYSLVVLVFLCFVMSGFGQILTFEFDGLVGNEGSAGSNSNDPNVASSTITRGSGLTAASNGDRFNATNWLTDKLFFNIFGTLSFFGLHTKDMKKGAYL